MGLWYFLIMKTISVEELANSLKLFTVKNHSFHFGSALHRWTTSVLCKILILCQEET